MTPRPDGRTALITGAATGIGRATASLLARNGARVVLFGLGEADLDAAAAETSGHAVHGDVTRAADIARAIGACGARLDIVVNAAGLIVPDQPASVSDEVWARTLDVNLTGTMRVCRAALSLLKQRGGAVVNIAPLRRSMRARIARAMRSARRPSSPIRARLPMRTAPTASAPMPLLRAGCAHQ